MIKKEITNFSCIRLLEEVIKINKIKNIFDYYFNIICVLLLIFLISGICVLIYRDFNDKSDVANQVLDSDKKDDSDIEMEDNNEISVDLKGAVKKPGVYKINVNTNINDLIKLAGGLTKNADTSNINLSKKVTDQMVIKIYTKSEIKQIGKESESECVSSDYNITSCIENNASVISETKEGTSLIPSNDKTTESESKKISLNNSNKEELMKISGVGESKAIAIIEYRNANGPFKSIDEIKNVNGFGDALYEKIKDNITI